VQNDLQLKGSYESSPPSISTPSRCCRMREQTHFSPKKKNPTVNSIAMLSTVHSGRIGNIYLSATANMHRFTNTPLRNFIFNRPVPIILSRTSIPSPAPPSPPHKTRSFERDFVGCGVLGGVRRMEVRCVLRWCRKIFIYICMHIGCDLYGVISSEIRPSYVVEQESRDIR